LTGLWDKKISRAVPVHWKFLPFSNGRSDRQSSTGRACLGGASCHTGCAGLVWRSGGPALGGNRQPSMFRQHITASCTSPGAGEYFLQRAQQYSQSQQPPADLYLAVGSLDEGQLPGFTKLTETLTNGTYPSLRVVNQVFDGEGHCAGVIDNTFLRGVKSVFRDIE
jgi:hypothetical protein